MGRAGIAACLVFGAMAYAQTAGTAGTKYSYK